jgi:hypothetical protein
MPKFSISEAFDAPDRDTPDGKWRIPCDRCGISMYPGPGCGQCDDGYMTVDPIPLRPPCTLDDHTFVIELDGGSFSVRAKDPHSAVECEAMVRWAEANGRYPMPMCDVHDDYIQNGLAGEIEVKLTHIDDSTPSTPSSPAEYGYWIEFSPISGDESTGGNDDHNDSDQ